MTKYELFETRDLDYAFMIYFGYDKRLGELSITIGLKEAKELRKELDKFIATH